MSRSDKYTTGLHDQAINSGLFESGRPILLAPPSPPDQIGTNVLIAWCDYSLHNVKSRPAKVGDKLTTRDFGTGTRGFAASEDPSVAVCVLPGTELAFAYEVKRLPTRLWLCHDESAIEYKTAIFRQVNKDKSAAHHDALEFPDGRTVLLTRLCAGQEATVLQLPARPTSAAEAAAQKRVTYVG
jgi:hypothetical protein